MVKHNFSAYQGVIFDLDGTLYLQRPLRLRMMARMLWELGPRPRRWGEARLLRGFRCLREELAQKGSRGISQLQYELCAQAVGTTPGQVRRVVDYWMQQAPLQHLRGCRAPGVERFWSMLKDRGLKIAVASDYPVADKLAALGLRADAMVSAEEPEVDMLKPDPAGFLTAARRLGLNPGTCLVIGDRPERDGEAAHRAGMNFLLFSPKETTDQGRFASYLDLTM